MSSLSPSEPPELAVDIEASLPASWSLVGLLIAIHVGTGLWWAVARGLTWWAPVLLNRPRGMRVALGGQVLRKLEDGEWWRLATSTFLHADGLHITLNAIGLLALGRLLEPTVGGWRMLALFAAGGVGGSLASWAAGVRLSDGASGGAFALLGAITVIGWMAREHTAPIDRNLFGPVLWGFLVFNIVLSFLVPVIDVAGHLGGLAVGLVLGLVFGRSGRGATLDIVVVLSCAAWCLGGWLSLLLG